jgi:hypothetical protein
VTNGSRLIKYKIEELSVFLYKRWFPHICEFAIINIEALAVHEDEVEEGGNVVSDEAGYFFSWSIDLLISAAVWHASKETGNGIYFELVGTLFLLNDIFQFDGMKRQPFELYFCLEVVNSLYYFCYGVAFGRLWGVEVEIFRKGTGS